MQGNGLELMTAMIEDDGGIQAAAAEADLEMQVLGGRPSGSAVRPITSPAFTFCPP